VTCGDIGTEAGEVEKVCMYHTKIKQKYLFFLVPGGRHVTREDMGLWFVTVLKTF
jgi:hypothetical protein